MLKSKTDYENTVVKILNIIISGQRPEPEMIPECSERDFYEILYQCSTDELILGFSVGRSANGEAHGQYVGTLYVTFKGLQFIDSVLQAQALDVAKNAEEKSISALIKANKSYILSGISIAIAVLSNLDKIVHNVQKVLSYLSTL